MINFKQLIFICFFTAIYSTDKIDINNANFNEMSAIDISERKLNLIYEYINSHGDLNTIYDLLNIKEIDSKDFYILKNSIVINTNSKKSNFQYDGVRLLTDNIWSSKGVNSFLTNHYYNNFNVNEISYEDLISIKNVSPMDAVAVLKQQNLGDIKGTFQLKNSPGISYYGYKNILDYINFTNDENLDKDYNFRVSMGSSSIGISNANRDSGELSLNFRRNNNPGTILKAVLTKNLLNDKNKITFNTGVSRQNILGDPSGIYDNKSFLSVEGLKLFNTNIKIDRIILGNFVAAFGQGLVFDSMGKYNRNSTGYKFDKRLIGLYSDLTYNHGYILKGIGGIFSSHKIKVSMFASKNKRDAVINSDGSFTSLIILTPRLGYGYYNNTNKVFENMIGAVNEITYGGNVRFAPNLDTYFGVTMYESLYDRILDHQVLETIVGGPDPDYQGDENYLGYYSNSADSEIEAMHESVSDSWLWDTAKSSRQVTGFNFSKIMGSFCVNAEYAELNLDPEKPIKLFDNDPNAFIMTTFLKLDTFDLILLFRDYDLHFDNPYQRSFSEYQKFKSTILEDTYWLEDPIYANLYSNNPQPQAEKGFYIESRYQFAKNLIGSIEYDFWIRKADEAQYTSLVSKLEWRPVFNYRINFRYKIKSRGEYNTFHNSPFTSREARLRFKLRLSNFDAMEFLYVWNYTSFNPKPRLVDSSNPLVTDMTTGDIGAPDKSIGVSITHNFDEDLSLKSGILYQDGFLWYIQGDTFLLSNTNLSRMTTWMQFSFKPSQLLYCNLHFSYSSQNPSTIIDTGITDYGYYIDNPVTFNEGFFYKIQFEYVL